MQEFQAAGKRLKWVEGQVGFVIVSQGKGVAPPKGELTCPAKNGQSKKQETANEPEHPVRLLQNHGGRIFDAAELAPDNEAYQPGACYQQQYDAQHRIGLPDHTGRNGRITHVIEHAGVETGREVAVVCKIYRIKKYKQKSSESNQNKSQFPAPCCLERMQRRKTAQYHQQQAKYTNIP